MKRFLLYNLVDWLTDSNRKPIILFGARQVGKTHLVRMLGKQMPSFIEINLEQIKEAANVFKGNLDPERMIRELSLISDQEIVPGKTLLFLDEIQEEPRAITALRYFYEECPELHVIAAGSLLDFAIQKVGVPVGRITFRYLHPLSYIEFLCTCGFHLLAKAIIEQNPKQPLNEAIHNKALTLLGEYIAVGGMPEAVMQWRETKNLKACQAVLQNITIAYENDFPKYAKKHQIKYVELLYKQLPRHITKRFNYTLLESSYKKRELEPALNLLQKARIINIVYHSHGTAVPLGAELDHHRFKYIMLDVALTQSILGLNIKDWFLNPAKTLANKGEIAEAFIGQEIIAYQPPNHKEDLYYWYRTAKGSQAEVDYLIQFANNIIPVEVKSGHGAQLQSLRQFLKERPRSPYGIRFSIYNYSLIDKLQNYPLYAVACIAKENSLLMRLIENH